MHTSESLRLDAILADKKETQLESFSHSDFIEAWVVVRVEELIENLKKMSLSKPLSPDRELTTAGKKRDRDAVSDGDVGRVYCTWLRC